MSLLLFAALTLGAGPGDEQLELLKTFREEFIEITPGKGKFPVSFTMGGQQKDAMPPHKVTFKYAFAIAKYEVPQNLWQAVMGSNPSRWKGPRNSVEVVSRADCIAFCQKVTKLMREAKLIDANQSVRLPSEAEWEYTARAGTTTPYSFGDVAKLDNYAWHTGNAAGNDPPVGAKLPNPWGLYDVHGYLWEWTADDFRPSYKGAPADGSAVKVRQDEKTGKVKGVIRGGSWRDAAPLLTSGFRNAVSPELEDDATGLRCVLETTPAE